MQTFPSPMNTGQALPRVSELTVQGGPGAEGPQPAWDSGALAWVGRVEGFLEEVWHASGLCRVGGEVVSVEAWKEPGFPSVHRGWVAQAWALFLLSAMPTCLPPYLLVSPGGVPGGCPPVLRDMAGMVGYGWSFVWVLASLSNLTHCWCPPLGLFTHRGVEVGQDDPPM